MISMMIFKKFFSLSEEGGGGFRVMACGRAAYHCKVLGRAEILPRDFLQTLGNYYLSFTTANLKFKKNFKVKKFRQFLKTLTVKLSIFRTKGLITQRY